MENQSPKHLGQRQENHSTKHTASELFARKEKAKCFSTGVYALLVLCVFPLVYHNFYFDMIQTKYITYCICVGILAAGVLLIVPILWYMWYASLSNEQRMKEKARFSPKEIWKSLSIPDKAVLTFWLIEVISTVSSQYPYESFWGNEGRFSGLFLTTLYIFAYFSVSRLMKFQRWYLDAFLGSAMLVCLFGITDYFQMDILHFKEMMKEEQLAMFVSSIGNINTYTALVGMVSAVASVLFAKSEKWSFTVWYYFCMTISFFAIIMGLSDNAYLALAGLFGFLPFYLFKKKSGIKRYLVIVATFFTVIQCVGWINDVFQDKVLGIDGAFNLIVEFRGLLPFILLLWAVAGVWQYMDSRKEKASISDDAGRFPRCIWFGVVVLVVLAVIFMLYDCNIAGNVERYGSLSNYLLFNDDWGTHRGYIWRIGMENYKKFSPWQKLVGFGPDTFGIVTFFNNFQDMMIRYGERFDNAHNEFLNYLITVGIAGLVAYVTFILSLLVRGFKKGGENPAVAAMLFAVICYNMQAFVNLNLPIVTPIMWMFLMMSMAAVNEKEKHNTEKYEAEKGKSYAV
ncbi:MAG: O-antigen ligase family protein [bacterium]|nr:O-antigen ligase family protein [bacterium]